MVVGDVINTYVWSFQPAAGVEIMILTQFFSNTNGYFGITDGVSISRNYWNTTIIPSAKDPVKFGITNTDYYYTNQASPNGGFSGIQIK